MGRILRIVSLLILLEAGVLSAQPAEKTDTAAYARRVVARHIEQELATEEWGYSHFKFGVTGYRIEKVFVDEKKAHVTVAFRIAYKLGCDGARYYRPARWTEYTYEIHKTVLGTPEMRREMTWLDILSRKQLTEIEQSTLYYIIAGTFRSEKRAQRSAAAISPKVEGQFVVLRSSDFAGLRTGYFVVVEEYGGGWPWQTTSLAQARRTVASYAEQGIESYIVRIPPLKHRPR